MTPPSPARAASATASCAASRACAGARRASTLIARGSSGPPGRTPAARAAAACSRVSAVRRRSAGVARRRRGRSRRGSVIRAPRGWGQGRAATVATARVSASTSAEHRLLGRDAGERAGPRRAASAAVRRADADRRRVVVGGGPSWSRQRADRAGRREQRRADRAVGPRLAHVGGRWGGGHRAVGDDVVDVPAAAAQPVGERRRRRGRRGGTARAGRLGRRAGDAVDERRARSTPPPAAPGRRATPASRSARAVPGPDGRDPDAAVARRAREAPALACGAVDQHRHGGGAGHDEPAVPAGAEGEQRVVEGRGVLGRHGLDERHDDGLGARGGERDDRGAAAGRRARDEDAPPGDSGRTGVAVIATAPSAARSAAPASRSVLREPRARGVARVGVVRRLPSVVVAAAQRRASRPGGRRPRRGAGCGRRRPGGPRRRSVPRSRPRGGRAGRARRRPRGGWAGGRARAGRRRERRRSASAVRTSTASAPCPGAGAMTSGSKVSVTASSRPSRARPARARTTASRSRSVRSRDPAEAGVDVAADVDDLEVGRAASSCAARRGEPVPTRAPAGSVGERQPVAGAQRVARVLARRDGRDDEPVGVAGGQVLEGVDRDVAAAVEQRRRAGR